MDVKLKPAILVCCLLVMGCSQKKPVSTDGGDVEWPLHGLNAGETRYSQLKDINQDNVDQLGVAWTYELDSTRGVETTPREMRYTITGAPRIANGRVVIGNGGAEYGVRGFITAYDVATGSQQWRFYTVPGDPAQPLESPDLEQALPTWSGEWWKVGGGGTAWDSMAFDPALNLLYVGTGNSSPWSRYARNPKDGDNLYVSSILAIDIDSGRLQWHYQTTPADNWDYTATQHIVLTDIVLDGKPRKVLLQAPKNGFLYMLDRVSGELLAADPYISLNWASHVDLESGRPVEVEQGDYRSQPRKVIPGPQGGHNWQPMSLSDNTGLLYIPAQVTGMWYMNDEGFEYDRDAWNLSVKWDTEFDQLSKEFPAEFRGQLVAWDPVKGKPRWRRPHSQNWNGGLLSTAGGLVFQGTADGMFTAYSDRGGELLWQAESTTGFFAPPMTYRIDGEQYIAIAAGIGGGGMAGRIEGAKINEYKNEGRIVVFKLGGKGTMPVSELRDLSLPELPPQTATLEQIQAGEVLYDTYCNRCHGTSGLIPDLRYLTPEKHAMIDKIVLEGAFLQRGMPRFDDALDKADVMAIQAHIIEASIVYREELKAAE